MVRRTAWAVPILMLLPACMPGEGPRYEMDAGPVDPGVDAGSPETPPQDGSLRADAGTEPPAAGEFYDTDDGVRGGGCFDGIDNDADGASDCADTSCRLNLPFCCVGVTDAECCLAAAPVVLPIDTCAGSVDACAALALHAEPFGFPLPQVAVYGADGSPAALVPGGQSADSGILLRDTIDPRAQAVTLEASIAGEAGAHSEGADVIGVGLVEADRASGFLNVAPAVAVTVSGNRGEISLLVAGEIVQRWTLETSGFQAYALEVRPGLVRLRIAERSVATVALRIASPVRPVLYGRTFNPTSGSPSPVRVASLTIRKESCDLPSALGAGRVQVLPPPETVDPGWASIGRVAHPSVVRWTDELDVSHERMAAEIDGAVYLARRGAAGWETTTPLGAPVFAHVPASGEPAWADDGIADPVLVRAGGALELWFTGYANGVGTVARVRAASGTETFSWDDVEILFAPDEQTRSFTQPAPYTLGAITYVIMRTLAAGSIEHALTRHVVGSPGASAPVRAPQADQLFALDRDEIGAPVVELAGGVHRLYYAGRRGARWSIATIASRDGLDWSAISESVVLEPSGAGFDAFGVRDPSLLVDGETLQVFYTAIDASGTVRVGVVSGTAPPAR